VIAGAERSGRLTERLVVVFLVLAVGVLAYVRFEVVPAKAGPPPAEFDLRNPMLDARIGECVEVESTTRPGEIVCMEVVDPATVMRPRFGPDRVGPDEGVRRSPPYLVCRLRYPRRGSSCPGADDDPAVLERFDLNGFGLPSSTLPLAETIRPLWVERAGRYRFVYEVALTLYAGVRGVWIVYLDPDAPVTGTIYRSFARERADYVVFREIEGCATAAPESGD
jgi:hypothetical protein